MRTLFSLTLVLLLVTFSHCNDNEQLLPPVDPELISPLNNSIGQDFDLIFLWNESEGADKYDFQLSLLDDFSSAIVIKEDQSAQSIEVNDLNPSTTYFWRVLAKNDAGNSPWSPVSKFSTKALNVPSLISPVNNLLNLSRTIEFKWNVVNEADSYEFQISTSEDFINQIIEKTNLASTTYSISGLMYSTNYYWRVRSEKSGIQSDWSEVRKFTTESLGIPELLLPLNNITLTNYPVELTWSSVSEATSYSLQISTINDFTSITINKDGLTDLIYSVSTLKANTKYYWRVNAKVEGCQSEWSSMGVFNTPVIPLEGLIAWYPFNGNANDESGNGNHGAINGGVTSATDRHNNSNKAFSFDGTSGYIEISRLNSLNYKPVSYSVWVIIDTYFPLSPGIKFRSIIGRQDQFNTTCGMLGFYADQNVNGGAYDNTFLYWMGATSTPDVPYSEKIPEINKWIHVVFSQDMAGNFKFHLNGILTNSGIISNTQNSNIAFRIGAGIGANSFYWNNKIDDVRVYGRVLNASEILTLYNE